MKFSKIASRDDLVIVGFGDASFKSEEKTVGSSSILSKLKYDKSFAYILEVQDNS